MLGFGVRSGLGLSFGMGLGWGVDWAWVLLEQGLRLGFWPWVRCAEVSCVKDRAYVHVQLESLILAQNERWRQA